MRGRRGDVLLAHYLLGHNIGGNDESDRTRRAIYWRLWAEGHEARRDKCLMGYPSGPEPPRKRDETDVFRTSHWIGRLIPGSPRG